MLAFEYLIALKVRQNNKDINPFSIKIQAQHVSNFIDKQNESGGNIRQRKALNSAPFFFIPWCQKL